VKNQNVRVRFAPSPTGFLHVGGARTALFNWLFARHNGGRFILRIEDTDVARFKPEFVRGIYDALRWLNLDWDEGPDIGGEHHPYVQSERVALHRQAAERLRADGRVYECYCAKTPAEAADGDDDDADGSVPAACRCAELSEAQRARMRIDAGAPALRFRVDPSRAIAFGDVIRGDVVFPPGTIEDFVIVKSDGTPLYNFAATIDDHTMEITHVIRGEEHLANTPKQLLIYEALGWEPPVMAHIPIILNEQRRKLSKRDGATFVNDYESMGFLPEALLNFLVLLGWSPGDNREVMTVDEMVGDFRLENVVKHPAIFDVAKLAWMNKEYLKKLTPRDAAAKVSALLPKRLPQATRTQPDHVERVTTLLIDRVRTLADIVDQGSYFFTDGPVEPDSEALAKHCTVPETIAWLSAVRDALAQAPGFAPADIEAAIRSLAQHTGVKAAAYIHPLRVALTGQSVSPGIFDVASIIGREMALKRIDALLSRLAGTNAVHARATRE
jgi:nondiscriminating glutamyl-tRNA synthetase